MAQAEAEGRCSQQGEGAARLKLFVFGWVVHADLPALTQIQIQQQPQQAVQAMTSSLLAESRIKNCNLSKCRNSIVGAADSPWHDGGMLGKFLLISVHSTYLIESV